MCGRLIWTGSDVKAGPWAVFPALSAVAGTPGTQQGANKYLLDDQKNAKLSIMSRKGIPSLRTVQRVAGLCGLGGPSRGPSSGLPLAWEGKQDCAHTVSLWECVYSQVVYFWQRRLFAFSIACQASHEMQKEHLVQFWIFLLKRGLHP